MREPDLEPHPRIDDPAAWLDANAPAITALITRAARRRRLRPQDADELRSLTWTHLLKDDCRVIRRYRGVSTMATYLYVVVERVLLDMRTAQWGKWRPSAAARRLGPHAVLYERLVRRDGMTTDEAREIVGLGPAGTARPALPTTAPASDRRRCVELDSAAAEPSPDAGPLDRLLDEHRAGEGRRLARELAMAVRRLPESDRELLRLRHRDGLRIAEIAAALGLRARNLYPRLAAIHTGLRRRLSAAGVTRGDVLEAAGRLPPCRG